MSSIGRPECATQERVITLFTQQLRVRRITDSKSGYIRHNADLAKKPPECLEYIVGHELVHLLESIHKARFFALRKLHLLHLQ